jgi:hypothetical protein
MQLVCTWLHVPMLSSVDFLTLIVVLVPLDMLWVYAMIDSVDYATRVAALSVQEPAGGAHTLIANGWRALVPAGVLQAPRLPLMLLHGDRPASALSFRHTGFATALIVATQLAYIVVVLSLTLGFGFSGVFWHGRWTAYDAVAIYSTMAVAGVAAGSLWALHDFPSVVVMWGSAVPLLLLWLLATADPFGTYNGIIMVLCAATVCVYALHLLGDALTERLWPAAAFAPARWLWIGVLAAVAAWAVWLFAFYTVWLQVMSWHGDHPAVWTVCGIALLVVAIIALMAINRRQLLLIALRITAYERLCGQTRANIDRLKASRSAIWAHLTK